MSRGVQQHLREADSVGQAGCGVGAGQGQATHVLSVLNEEDKANLQKAPGFGRFSREKQNSTSFGIIQYLVFV
jgi:hypothetical protein